jgi:transcriptional regulator with GAF, ATPase, and Fis domain/CHASE2 domain-containing sensor protein
MADTIIPRSSLLAVAGVILAALLLLTALPGPVSVLEDQVTAVKYAVRGERVADTNIVIVYLDEATIKITGWPVRRNFHALMLKALSELRVRAVGMEMLFEDQKPEYPEYDDLLAGMIAGSSNTVLTCYVDSLHAGMGGVLTDTLPKTFRFPSVARPPQYGAGLHLPLPSFLGAAAGVGHVNFTARGTVPVFLAYGEGVIPSFGTELVRVYAGIDRAGVAYDGETVRMQTRNVVIQMPTSDRGEVRLLYPGPLSSFAAHPFLEVLRAYDLARTDMTADVLVRQFRDKIILVGIVAEGRGVVYDTPVDPRLPSIGLHATFVDNALYSGFLLPVSPWIVACLALFLGAGCSVSILFLRPPIDIIGVVVCIGLTLVVSFGLFVMSGILLPLLEPVFVALAAVAAGVLIRHRLVRRQVDVLTGERNGVRAELRDKEARLTSLERELLDFQSARSGDRTEQLLEEIRRYKAEIRTLSSRAEDMEVYAGEGEKPEPEVFEGIVYGKGGRIKPLVGFITKIAGSEAPVLILGESGTGKELVARAIHRRSKRPGGPFIAVNCGALTESLLESELFGHERGAFTGAVKERLGRFEMADGGTIFLDEIGEVSEGFQLKLLRVIQEGELERVGGTKTIKLNVRIVAATNRDLREQVKAKRFREDLYYRLNVLTVALPPLRERQEDIGLLTGHFLEREGGALRVSRNVMDALQSYGWPGNVRELESVIRRGALLAKAEQRSMISINDLTDEVAETVRGKTPVQEQILDLMREFGFSRSAVSETAVALGGLNRGTAAEYLRGECLKAFAEQQFDLEKAVLHISLSSNAAVNERVRKRLVEYLSNIVDAIDPDRPWEDARVALKPKTRNLPRRYHHILEQVAEACYRGIWKLPIA